ncbi:uncharacterized protein LOC124163337 [Ischnura elegans]|uniref:uncharacterized protein LOC124163337 n=1 Tax=Ischnura elegans TaxID=197161 RepID=UPI001ED8736D|nr:uncharacterized protein LOC124163337 [Ischnura elegans]
MRAWRIPFFECLFCVLLGATTMANDEAISSCPLGPEAEESIENTVLIPCGICGRTFKSESLLKHQSVCQKNATKKRRVFDSMKQRIRGTELAEYIPIPVVPPKPKLIPVSKPAVKKVSKDELRTGESPNVGQHSNTPAAAEKTPVRLAVTRSNSVPRGGGAFREERCPHCDRTFGWKAFSRHEEWCREHKSRLAQAQSPAAVLKAKEMLEARIKYRAPSLGKSKRPTNREKYSGGVHMSPAVHKLSVDNSPVLSSMKPTVSSSNKVVSESRLKAVSKSSTPQASAAMPPHQANTPSAPTPRRALSPSKKISRVIQNPWQSSGGVDKSSGSDEVISQPVGGGNRNKLLSGMGVDSSPIGDYDKVFDSIPPLEYYEDKDKEEELLRWIRHVKTMLKKQNNPHSEEKCEERAVDLPDDQSEMKKGCTWELEGAGVDERMRRTFVYEALNSSDESNDDRVVCSSDLSHQNKELIGFNFNKSGKQFEEECKEGCRDLPAEIPRSTLANQKTESMSSGSAHALGEVPSNVKGMSVENSLSGMNSPLICSQSVGVCLNPVCDTSYVCKKMSNNQPRKTALTKDCKGKKELVKRRSKLPVPVSNFYGRQKNVRAILAAYNEMMTASQPPPLVDFSINLPAKKLNNTFILPEKALKDCSVGEQNSHSDELSHQGLEIDSLESSSGGTSPLLQKGIIHKYDSGSKTLEYCIVEDDTYLRDKSRALEILSIPGGMHVQNAKSGPERVNDVSFPDDSGKECSEEACSVPVHLLMKNSDSSRENSCGFGVCNDLNGSGNSPKSLYEAATYISPVAREARASQSPFRDLDYCHGESNDDWSHQISGNINSKNPSHAVLSELENVPDSPLDIKDLSVSSEIRTRKRKKGKGRKRSSQEPRKGDQEKSKGETASCLERQPSPFPIAEEMECCGEGFAVEGPGDVHRMSKGFLPVIHGEKDDDPKICSDNSVERVTDSQHKWLKLIRNLSESEIGCAKPLPKVLEMHASEDIDLPHRRGVSKKSSTFGLTLSDRKAAENRVKARLFGKNWQEKSNVSSSGLTATYSHKMVTVPSARAQPVVTASIQGRRSFSPVIVQPNLKPSLSFPFKRLSGKDESLPRLPPPSRQSTYDPFSRAEMQLQELLSDGTARSHSSLAAPSCKEAVQNGSLEKLENISAKTNGNNEVDRHCIEKQAKEIELPDIFTETSTQLDFEMPSVTRSRDRSVNTKRRALKPTPQNMGIELIRRDNYAGLSASPMEKSTGNIFEDEEVEQITSIMDLGFCIPHLSQGGVQARDEIESIHQSINLVALGLSNLSAASPRSMADKDNNNGQEEEGKRGGGSLGDSDSEGGGERVPKAPLAGRAPAQQASSHESLTGTQPLIVGKPSVDSAYSSLNRPAFRTIEQAKEAAVVSAFDLPHHGSSSSEGENEHEWSDGEGGGTLRGSRLNAEANSNSVKYAKFCHNCGSKYPLSEAKFCCVCGAQRLAV